jgi:hypothetical protein
VTRQTKEQRALKSGPEARVSKRRPPRGRPQVVGLHACVGIEYNLRLTNSDRKSPLARSGGGVGQSQNLGGGRRRASDCFIPGVAEADRVVW